MFRICKMIQLICTYVVTNFILNQKNFFYMQNKR